MNKAEEIWNEACKQTLKAISEGFLNPVNQSKAERLPYRLVFQAIGETITNFPIPECPYASSVQPSPVSSNADGNQKTTGE